MRIIFACAVLCLIAVAGCTSQQVQEACAYDAAGQPIAAATIGALVPGSAGLVALDTTIIHPAVQSACPALSAAAATAPTAAPAAD